MAGESALGSTLAGAGNVIGAVGSLLPTTTTQSGSYENEASASSSTVGIQGNIGANTTTSKESNTTVQDVLNKVLSSTGSFQRGSETSIGKTTQSGATSNIESFSGQANQTTQQTLLTDPAVMRIINLMLQGDGGVPGLQQVASGERNAGLYNSSSNQLLLNNLLTTVAGEVARISAPVVTNQNLGATSTEQSGQSSVVADTINNILSQLAANTDQSQTGSTKSTGTSDTSVTQDTLSQILSFALQGTEQESESKGSSRSKTNKGCKFFALVGVLCLPNVELEVAPIRAFRDTYISKVNPDIITHYYANTSNWVRKFERLDMNTQYRVASYLYTNHLLKLNEAYKAGNNELAHYHYNQLIKGFNVISGEA